MITKTSQFCWEEWRKQQSEPKYLHFDKPTSLMHKNTWAFVRDPVRVAKHGFYPFIYYKKDNKKIFFDKDENRLRAKIKSRPICYSAHKDRCIFKYYGKKLNLDYEVYLEKNKLGDNVLAYRSGMPSHYNNNICFAKKAFDSISKYKDCYVIIGDFEKFFDQLEHAYLKKRLSHILRCKSNFLEPDWFAVFNAITQFKIIQTENIAKLMDSKSYFEYQRMIRASGLNVLFHKKQFRLSKSLLIEDIAKLNPDIYGQNAMERTMGIPQGSAISGVLSNVYMTEFDEKMRDLANALNGIYLRYSDDFILVTPRIISLSMEEIWNSVKYIVKEIPKLTLSKEKVAFYKYCENGSSNRISKINDLGNVLESNIHRLDYLGFSFDGYNVRMRDRTISRYFVKMVKSSKHQYKRVANKLMPNYCSMYRRFTSNCNRKPKTHGKNFDRFNKNFITYSNRAERIFGKKLHIPAKIRQNLVQIRKIRRRIARMQQ